MLWIALSLPELPLQLAQRSGEARSPLVIIEGPPTRPVVCCADSGACARGVIPGMTLAAAQALTSELAVVTRACERETRALHSLACWAGQFTPHIALRASGLLLEIGSTLRLHGGLKTLLAALRRGLTALGYRATAGVAPTPRAAALFADARQAGQRVRPCTDKTALPAALAPLPLTLLGWPEDVMKPLRALGLCSIGDCLALPRDGFTRRFGHARRHELDQALGNAPDPRAWFTPPATFTSRVEFGFEINDAQALLFPLQRLLGELEGFLRGRGAGVQQWQLLLEHTSHRRTALTMRTAAPARSAERLLTLARERLTSTILPDPVLALGLAAEQLCAFAEDNHSLVPDARNRALGWGQLIDRLNARLGDSGLYRLQVLDDHRPERGWRRVAAAQASKEDGINVADFTPPPLIPRPLWLLPTPYALAMRDGTPLYPDPLYLLAGPERIEAGWWDSHHACRDYYVARNGRGATLWIYREHRREARWYLHGIFA